MGKFEAAGAVIFRRQDATTQVAMIHRPRYDDWTFPKGKLHKGESAPVAAVREVLEETGLGIRLGAPLGHLDYPVRGKSKRVHFWCATVTSQSDPLDDEADELAWFSFAQARQRCTYKHYMDLVDVAKHCRETTPLIILRHAKALDRSKWNGLDIERPLNPRGRRQSTALIPLLRAYGIRRVITSPAVRCVDTIAPFVESSGATVEFPDRLTEEAGGRDQREVQRYLREVARETGDSGVPTVVCGHRPLLPAMLRGIGQAPTSFATADALVAHLSASGRPQIDEFHTSTL